MLRKFDIKLISEDFSEEDKFGEAWFFGITKVKKNQLITYVVLDGELRTIEIEVSGNEEDQITAFLAEIGDKVRQHLIDNNIITPKDGFYDIRISVLSKIFPYCYASIFHESVQRYIKGEPIKCTNCDVEIKIISKP